MTNCYGHPEFHYCHPETLVEGSKKHRFFRHQNAVTLRMTKRCCHPEPFRASGGTGEGSLTTINKSFTNKAAFTLAEGATHINRQDNNRKRAFTIAEVLITLGIIGVVAAMTLPTLISSYQEKVTITKLKKIYSELNQAFLMATMDGTKPEDWLAGKTAHTQEAGEQVAKRLKKHLKVFNDCYGSVSNKKCWPTDLKILRDSWHWSAGALMGRQSSTFATADGYFIGIDIYSADCSIGYATDGRTSTYVCGHVWVDTNGNAAPNTIGRDFFLFYVTNDGIIPAGMQDEIDNKNPFYKTCAGDSGAGCTAWVLINGNMDYIRCSDLSWNGKQSCK